MESYVNDITQCPICKDGFTDPRSLPCLHTFCLKCLKGYCRGRGPGEEARCPLCRREFIIPEDGIDGVQKNFYFRGLVEQRKKAVVNSGLGVSDNSKSANAPNMSVVLCDGCGDETGNKAMSYCTECQEKLCESCGARCRKMRDKGHQVVTIINGQIPESYHTWPALQTSTNKPQFHPLPIRAKSMTFADRSPLRNLAIPGRRKHSKTSTATDSPTGMKTLLVNNYKILSRSLVASDELLTYLSVSESLKDKVKEVEQQPTPDDKVNKILTILRNVPTRRRQSCYGEFESALRRSGQEHVANIFHQESDVRPMSDEHYQVLLDKTEELRQFINPTHLLLNKLLALKVFNKRHLDSVLSKPNYTEMSQCIVDILLRQSDGAFTTFIEALNATDQQHVVNILTGDGEPPLSRLRRKVLTEARDIPNVNLKYAALMTKLIANGVLSEDDQTHIGVQESNDDKNNVLFDAISRKSQKAYDKFLQALKDSGHSHFACVMEGLELRGIVEANFDEYTRSEDKNKIMKFVRDKMQALVSGTESEVKELTLLMEQNGFVVSEITEGSILITFRCFTEESLVNLKRLYADKTLDKLFTQVFCPQYAEQGLESLTLKICEAEFVRCAEICKKMTVHFRLLRQLTFPTAEHGVSRETKSPKLNGLPLELVLMKTLIALFTDHYKSHYKTHEAVQLAYSTLAGVCYNWWKTVNGSPSSPILTIKRKLNRAVKDACRPYAVSPRLLSSMSVQTTVYGVTRCDEKLFFVCLASNTIRVMDVNCKPLINISLKKMQEPRDIVSCVETQQLYVADMSLDQSTGCVWRVSLDGRQVVKWLPNKSTTSPFAPYTLSVTSRRLLVTSQANSELLLYGADGVELKRVLLPEMNGLRHAVETSRGTFITSHVSPMPRVCEVNIYGHVIGVYTNRQQLAQPVYLSLDSEGRVFVADQRSHCILLLNNRLELERVLLDTQHHLTLSPHRLCYSDRTGQLVIAGMVRNKSGGWSGCVQVLGLRFFTE